MSAFLVENDCINRILAGITPILKDCYHLRKLACHTLGIDINTTTNPEIELPEGWQAELGQKMFDLNLEALGARYGETDGKPEVWRTEQHPERTKYVYRSLLTEDIQAVKSAECYLYQCSEGEIDKTEVYQLIDTLKNNLMSRIVSNLPEYQEAEWE